MKDFINFPIKDRVEGAPGVISEEEFDIYINPANITVFNEAKNNPQITIVRMVCGVVLCVMMSSEQFKKKLMDNGSKIVEPEIVVKPKPKKKKK